jgi:DNA-binding CsgD family transcriptional regulator
LTTRRPTTSNNASVRPVLDRFLKRFNLSKRENEAVVLLAQGLRVKNIAHRMSCSEKTVYAHLARACKKTNCHDYHEVICMLLAFACHGLDKVLPQHFASNAPFLSISEKGRERSVIVWAPDEDIPGRRRSQSEP